MRWLRGSIAVLAALMIGVAAAKAGAFMGSSSASHRSPRAAPRAGESTEPTESPEPEDSPEPSDSSERSEKPGERGSGATGLDQAIARVSANLAAHPNHGLANALQHLHENQARHAAAHSESEPGAETKNGHGHGHEGHSGPGHGQGQGQGHD